MNVKVRAGTARHDGPSLCLSCRSALVVRGMTLKEEIVQCGRLDSPGSRVTFPVTFCTGYTDRNQPSLSEMEDTAWILRSDRRSKEAGFVRSDTLSFLKRHVLVED